MPVELAAWSLIGMLAGTGFFLKRTGRRASAASLRRATAVLPAFAVIAAFDLLGAEGQHFYMQWAIPCACAVSTALFCGDARSVGPAAVGFTAAAVVLTMHADSVVHQGLYSTHKQNLTFRVSATREGAERRPDPLRIDHVRTAQVAGVTEWHTPITGLYRVVGANRGY